MSVLYVSNWLPLVSKAVSTGLVSAQVVHEDARNLKDTDCSSATRVINNNKDFLKVPHSTFKVI